ncbi:MAG: hypothetical protein U1F87_07625 [Kiritimatiellia bacterium]
MAQGRPALRPGPRSWETARLAASQPDRVRSMAARLQRLRKDGHSRPGF